MREGIIYARSKQDSNMPSWKQLSLLLQYAKDIGFNDMGIIAVTEDGDQHDRCTIDHLLTMLRKHNSHMVMVLDMNVLSDNPAELALIQKRFADEGITELDLYANS